MAKINCLEAIKENIKKVVVGKDEVIDLLLVSLICSGHIIIEDLPGLGKTTLASALAASLGCDFQRIQFTPDVLPSDITGFNVYDINTGKKTFHKGSVHSQIVLADEINRASPKTQSALLEAMQERQVTVDGETYVLPKPFMILATENPVDTAGTYPLPEAQLDRFLMRINMGYPSAEAELEILKSNRSALQEMNLQPVATAEEIMKIQQAIGLVYISDDILKYIINITSATREYEGVVMGASPRGSIALTQAACGMAILEGRNFVTPDDVKRLAPYVLAHRMIMKNRSGAKGTTATDVIDEILHTVKVPKIKG
ncbi:MAG: MoxR family ATPase [Clostridia bacterium]|nr:MoxR family ATPase [Clostridia bacterium]MBR6564640.1 MoxR family ATPase [Clostridia bacterium]